MLKLHAYIFISYHLQVDLAHLLAARDQELRTLSAEVIVASTLDAH